MSIYADNIRAASVAHYRPGLQDTSALDLQAVAGEIAAAVEYLETLQRGAQIEFGAGAPGAALGLPGDAYIDTLTGDVHGYDAGSGWQLKGSFKGKDGKAGKNGLNGTTPVKGVDYKDGANGKSTFELYQQTGGQLSLPAWLASQHGKDGLDGAAGNKMRWESIAPTANDAGAVGDTWFYAKAADKVLIYECYRSAADAAADVAGGGQWRLRYTSPDAPTAGTGTGSGTANFPAQTPATTTGKSLMSNGTAGGEYWGYPNRVSYPLEFLNLLQARKKYFQAAKLLRFEKDAAVATLTYAINGAAPVAVPFAAGASFYVPPTPIDVPAGALVSWAITYASAANEAYAEVFAIETLPTI